MTTRIPESGHLAPLFTLPDQSGRRVALRDLAGRPVVLFFYPKDLTSACTQEACDFRDALPRLAALDAAVLGISPDPVESHAAFAAKHALPFPLLADVPKGDVPAVCATYGVWQEKSMYGRRYLGVVRTTLLIGPDRRIVRRWDRVRVKGHVAEVADAVAALSAPGAPPRARRAGARG